MDYCPLVGGTGRAAGSQTKQLDLAIKTIRCITLELIILSKGILADYSFKNHVRVEFVDINISYCLKNVFL